MPVPVVVNRLRFVNSWLVREDDGLTLIDVNIPGTADRIIAKARQLGAPIRRIAITHAHPDHVGSLDKLVARLPGVEVLISARDARPLNGDGSLEPHEPKGRKLQALKVTTRPTGVLAPGGRVGSLEVIAAPGHTPGHVALLDTRDRTLYCGDAFSTYIRVATTAEPRLPTPLPSLATWHYPSEVASARALRALDPARLAPGHGRVVEAPGEAMDAALARVADRY
jgi:glyoxylase-like metal-dependent hydrolase (beta-lactamase superfamily II)